MATRSAAHSGQNGSNDNTVNLSDPAETARYIENMARELGGLATESGLGFLAFLLRMVEDDAGATAKERGSPAKPSG
ncbi:hypothetical protein [Bauldia sp.]|uniref:hypothetical protein n=1 Tax=Bauldia sp. TaxID=2575872 RepID=UPI003BA97F04